MNVVAKSLLTAGLSMAIGIPLVAQQFTYSDMYLGGDGDGTGSDWIDWCMGNGVPFGVAGTDSLIFSTATGNFAQALSWNEAMRIQPNGYVGIGIPDPNEVLSVKSADGFKGAIRAENTDSRGRGIFAIASHPTGSNHALYAVCSSPNGYAGYFQGATWFNGNVGIETQNAQAPLHVNGRVRVGEDLQFPSTYGELIHDGAVGGFPNGFKINASGEGGAANVSLQTKGETQVFVSSTGKVGVGTIIPLATLHISGESSSDALFRISTDQAPAAVELIVTGEGNLGVGTDNPRGKLDVNGSIYQRGGQLHADYVFEPDYELETIEEHARFMWSNKHLKAIPKARVDDDGFEVVEVGSHRKGIVEELEKAHLFIEQLNDKIKALERRLARVEQPATASTGRSERSEGGTDLLD